MIKVLRIMHRINIGGPTHHAGYLTKYLNNQKFSTKLIVGNLDKFEKSGKYILDDMGVTPFYVNNMFRKIHLIKDIKAYYEIIKIIKEYKPDIVHTHAAKSGFLGRLAAISCNVPIIIHTFHGHVFHSYFNYFITRFYIFIERFLAKKSTKIIAISNLQKEELVNKFKIAPANKFDVVSLGFDLDKFKENQYLKRKSFRKEFNIIDDEIAIGIVGGLAPIKNHKLFIESINFIRKKTDVKLRFFIIGDGEERENIQKLCHNLDIQFNTHIDTFYNKILCFTSWRQDIDYINSGLDIMTCTSFNEGTPVSLIEAQASALPIVTTSVGGIKDVVIENKSALISKSINTIEFSNLLLKLINNKSLLSELSKNGRDHVFNKYTKDILVNNITNLYENLYKKLKLKCL